MELRSQVLRNAKYRAAIRVRRWLAISAVALAVGCAGLPNATSQKTEPGVVLDESLVRMDAAGLGLFAELILAYPQWRVLRRHLTQSALWLPANGLAWAIAMPIIFAAAGSLPESTGPGAVAVVILMTAGLVGLVVGAVHGTALVWILRDQVV